MLGLCGVVGSRPRKKSLWMFKYIDIENSAIEADYSESGSAGMAVSSLMKNITGKAVATSQEGILVGLNGEIFNLDSLLHSAGLAIQNVLNPADKILHLYKSSGNLDFIKQLYGAFSISLWDGRTKQLHLISDRYGLRPLYYYRDGETLLFSSEIRAIHAAAELPMRKNEHGLADFLLLGMPTGTRTLWKNVELIPPASVVTLSGKETETRKYWDMNFRKSFFSPYDLSSGMHAFKTVFSEVMSEMISDPIQYEIPLSGGLDSRCLMAYTEGNHAFRTYTLGSEGSRDLEIGQEIARMKNIPNTPMVVSSSDFINWIPRSVYLTEGMYNPIHSPILHLMQSIPSDARIILDGTNSFDGYYSIPDLAFSPVFSKYSDFMKSFLKICPEPVINSNFQTTTDIFKDEYKTFAMDLVKTSAEERIQAIPEKMRSNPFVSLDYLDQSNRLQRYNIMGTVLLRSRFEVRHPMFDQRIIDLIMDFGLFLKTKEKRLIGRFLAEIDPDLERVPYERTGLRANTSLFSHFALYGRRLTSKMLQKLPAIKPPPPRVAIDFNSFIQNDKTLQDYFKSSLLDGSMVNSGLFVPEKVEKALDELIEGKSSNWGITGRLLTFKLWNDFYKEKIGPPTP